MTDIGAPPRVDELTALEREWKEARQDILKTLLQKAEGQQRSDDVALLQDLLQSEEPVEWYHFRSYLEDQTNELQHYKRLDGMRADMLADLEMEEQQLAQKRKLRNTIVVVAAVVSSFFALFFLTPDQMAFEVRKDNVTKLERFQIFTDVSFFQSVELVQAMNLQPPQLTPKIRSYQSLQTTQPASLWGPATHVWTYCDEAGHIREVLWTGHAEARTRQSWWSLLYNTALTQKTQSSSQLLLSGLARLSFQYDCESSPAIETFLRLQRKWRKLWRHTSQQPKEPGKPSALDTSLQDLNRELQKLKQTKQIRAYTRCVEIQGRSFLSFSRQAKPLLAKDGLSVGHRLPFQLLQQARHRMEQAYHSKKEYLVVFHDLLRKAKAKQALVSFSMRWRSNGKPVVFQLAKADFEHESLPAARVGYQNELEQVMLGDAREREILYKRRLKNSKSLLAKCKEWKRTDPARLKQKIWIDRLCSQDGRCHMATTPISLSQQMYCKRYVPLNILLAQLRLRQTQELLQKIQNPKSLAKLRTFVTQVMWDSLLRNGPLPVGQYQAALWQWQAHMRRNIWSQLYRRMLKKGIPVQALADPRVVFRVHVKDKHVHIHPIWVVELSQTSFRFSSRSAVPSLEKPTSLSASTSSTCKFQTTTSNPPGTKDDKDTEDNPFLSRDSLHNMCVRGALSDSFYQYWNRQQDTTRWLGQVSALGRSYLDVMDTMQSFRAVSSDTLWGKGVFHATSRVYRVLRDARGVPPELHAQLAHSIATHIAFFMRRFTDLKLVPWDILAFVAGHTSKHSAAIGKLKSHRMFAMFQRRFYLDVRRYPFRLLQISVKQMRSSDRAFFQDWLQRQGSPKVRSRTMTLLQRYYPPSSLMEQQQIDYLRVVKYLKTYQALRDAARYLLTAQVARLRGLFHHMGRASLLTEADSLIVRRLQDLVGVISEDTHITNGKTRVLLATQLQRSARKMLQKSRDLLAAYSYNKTESPALRVLQARVFFEGGRYQKALQTLCKPQTPLAYYRPELKWKVLGKDWSGGVLNIRVEEKDKVITIYASPKGPAQPFLQLTGLSIQDRKELLPQLQSLGALEHPTRKASEQLLTLAVSLPSRVLRTFQNIQQSDVAKAMIRDMVYTCHPPGHNLIRNTQKCSFPFVNIR